MRIDLVGQIISDNEKAMFDYFDLAATCPSDIKAGLAEAYDNDEDVELWINSVGGDLWAASEMCALIRESPCKVTALVTGLSASAASVVMTACDRIEAIETAMVMIHLPQTSASGDYHDLHRSIEMLQAMTDSMLTVYADKTGCDRSELRNMLERETWLNAESALDIGFIDEIRRKEANVDAMPLVASALGLNHNTERLHRIYSQAIREKPPEADAADEDDWTKKAGALLDIEINRFG